MKRNVLEWARWGLLTCLMTTAMVWVATGAEWAQSSAAMRVEAGSGAGGVALFKAAELLTPADVSGARAEWVVDHLELVTASGSRLTCPPLDREYVALSIRCVFGGEEDVPGKLVADDERCIVVSTGRERYGEVVWNKQLLPRPWKSVPVGSPVKLAAGPGVGMMGTYQPSGERITYYGPITNTRLGKVLMEADAALGTMMYGVDSVTGKVVDYGRVPGFMTLIERLARGESPPPVAAGKGPWWESGLTWYVLIPDRFTLRLDPSSNRFEFAEARMRMMAWSGAADSLSPSSDEFARQVSDRYAELAEVHPALRDLIEAAKAVCFVRWMRDAGVIADTAWARDCPIQRVETVEYQSRIRVETLDGADGKPIIEKRSPP